MYNTSFCKYLTKLTVVFALFALLPIALGSFGIASTIGSYLMSILCFFIIMIVSAKLVLGENRYVRFYAIVFIVEILIGLLHYLYFVDSTYFSTNGDASGAFWHEYLSVYDAVSRLNDTRNSYGVFYWMTADEFQVTHPEIWHIISWPFYYLGNKWLNYSALNVFCCLLTSMNLVCLYLNFYPVNEDAEKKIRLWTAFFPSFLLSGTVWRDPFGIALISVGVVLTMLSRNMIEKVGSLILYGSFAFVQRTVYLFIAGVSSFWGQINRVKGTSMKLLLFVVGIFVFYYISGITSEVNSAEYNSGYINTMSFIALPIKIIFGMIGPFPWTLFPTLVERNPAFAWQLQDYLMGIFQLGFLFCIIFNWKRISFKDLDAMTVMGLGIMFSGFLTKQLHIGYVSEGLLFTLPWFFSQVNDVFNRYFRYSLSILVLLNILLLFVGNMSISSLWR